MNGINNQKHRKTTNKTLNINILLIIAIFIIIIILIPFINLINRQKVSENNTNTNSIASTNSFNTENASMIQSTNTTEKEKISNSENTLTQNSEKNNIPEITFNMLLTGDIMCHDTMFKDAYDKTTDTYDFTYMFDDIKNHLQNADITIGNLETTFAGKKKGYSNYPTFNTPEQLAQNLKTVGFDVVSTANNHSMDSGYNGIVSTLAELDKAELSHTGTYTSEESQNEILIKNVKGVRIAFLSYTYGTNGIPIPKDKPYAVNLIDKDLIIKHLELAKKEKPDMICVSMHWGIEYQTKPNKEQKDLADFLFNNGVDIIIGNHPHVPQSMEKRTIELEDGTTKDVFVIYSLGNLMADQRKDYTRDTALLNLNIAKKSDGKISINSVTYTPVYYLKDTTVSKHRFKFIDINKAIKAYEENDENKVSKALYNTLKSELKNIQNIIGEEI